jgi:predicted phage tail protein
VARGNDFGGQAHTAPQGSLMSVPYQYATLGSGSVKSSVVANDGQKLSF